MNLRQRILLAFTGLILAGFAALTAFAGQQISAGTIADFEGRLVDQARLIARGLHDSVEHLEEGEADPNAVAASLQAYGAQSSIAVNLLRADGRAWLGESIPSTLAPESAPEVAAAMRGQTAGNTRSRPDGHPSIYTAAPIYEDGELLAIVHLAAPLAGAQSLVRQRWLLLIAGFLLLAGLAVGVSLWLSASLTRPLAQLRQSALRIAEGDFSQRLPQDRRDEIGQLAGAFNHMAGQVEAMIEEQRTFAGNASHELRTPLTTIRLRSEALREGVADEQTARQYIIDIDDEVARLGDLVEDLILISRLDSGRLEAGQEEIDPARFVRWLAQEFAPPLAEKRLHLDLQVPDRLPPIRASLGHLQVVFRNILSNAIKYTPEAGRIAWSAAAVDGAFLSTISDTGQGIAPADLDHLFERFYRADKAHSRETPGVGLGLSLVKMIVEFYGGTIAIHSPGVGQGTVVSVRWPFNAGA